MGYYTRRVITKIAPIAMFPFLNYCLAKDKEGLIQSARAIRERFFATARRDFAGIIVFISRNHNEAVTENVCEAPRTH